MATQQFLPVGTNVVLAGPDRPAAWFKTRKIVIVSQARRSILCPVRRRRFSYQMENGFGIWYSERQIQTRTVADPVVPAGFVRTVPVPPPVVLDTTVSDFAEGILPTPAPVVAPVVVPTVPEVEVDEAVVAAFKPLRSATDANAQMTRAAETTGASEDEITAAQLKRAKAIQKRLATLEADLTKACGVFGISPRSLNVPGLGATARAIQTDMAAQARAFRAARRALEAQGAEGRAVSTAMANGSMDPRIAADYLDDQQAGTGEALRTAFTDSDVFDLPVEDDGSDE